MSIICANCGCELDENDIYTMGDTIMCEDCYDSNTRTCECCGTRIWNEDDEGDDNITLCRHCRDNHYVSCEDCGRLIHDDDAYYMDEDSDYPYCHSCYSNHKRKFIHSYSYKPDPIFHGDGKLYMGVELEIDGAGCEDSSAEILCDIASDSQLYIKTDGSLDEGMELVTHPMTLEYHHNTMPWRELTSKAISLGYRSHKTSTCGLHVHVNRTAFGSDKAEQDAVISRILFFIERFWQEMLQFSRRTESQINRWAARYGIKDNPKQVMDNAKSTGKGRYACINLCNYYTIEFRIFRGTLKYNTLISTLQMVDRICKAAISMTDEEITSLSWPEFVSVITEPELIQYLKERRLYVNEPVTETEEY
ncbi:MAG: amidoligase family protein [Oscillospiraceae bacterium]